MTAKEFLRSGYKVDDKINSNLRELEETQALAENISAAYGSERVQTSMRGDKIPNAVCSIVNLKEQIESEATQLLTLKQNIRTVIQSVTNPTKNLLLRMRYLEFKEWSEIRKAMGFEDDETMFKLHGRALKEIDRSGIIEKLLKSGSNVQ